MKLLLAQFPEVSTGGESIMAVFFTVVFLIIAWIVWNHIINKD
jgi:hypothetical protein